MGIKKSQTTKSSGKAIKVPVKKLVKTAKTVIRKPVKPIASSETEKKPKVLRKASAPATKSFAKGKTVPGFPAKTAGKKKMINKKATVTKKSEIKRPQKAAKKTIPSRTKGEAKPAAVKSGSKREKVPKSHEARKTGKNKIIAKKRDASSVKKTTLKKTPTRKPVKTVSMSKSVLPEKTALKKSPVKIVAKRMKTVKESAARKVSKAVAKKKEVKAAKGMKVAPRAKITKKGKKSTAIKMKPAPGKKPALTKAIPQIMAIGEKTALPSDEKTKAPLPASTTAPRAAISKKKAAAYPAPAQARVKLKKSAALKIFLPEEQLPPEEVQKIPAPKLPEEYGENELLLMEVDPSIVFASWEIKPDDISGETGRLTLRVYDVTGIDFDGSYANRFFDIRLNNRLDSKFFDLKMPGRDVIMEIGLLDEEEAFKALKRSNKVSMPALQTFEELGLTGSLSDSDTLIGY